MLHSKNQQVFRIYIIILLIGVGAGNSSRVQRIFCPNLFKFARKAFMQQSLSLQIFCSCWYILFFL